MTDFEDRLDRLEAEKDRLRTRVDDLEEAVAVEDAEGRTVTLPTLESYGLTRRQALSAMALLTAGGYTLSGAIVDVVRGASTSSGRYAAKAMQTREIRDENDNIAIDLPGNGSVVVDVLNTADASAAAQGEVLQKGASGTDLTFGSITGSDWTPDSNSPFTATGANSITCSLSDRYDEWEVYVKATDINGNLDDVDIQANGDTGTNYTNTDYTGSHTGSASNVPGVVNCGANETGYGRLSVSGRWSTNWSVKVVDYQSYESRSHVGANTNITVPLTQFTLSRGVSTDWTVIAEGRDIS